MTHQRSHRETAELEEVADALAATRRRMEISGVDDLEDAAEDAPLAHIQAALRAVLARLDPDRADRLYRRITTYGATVRQAQRDEDWRS